MIFLTKNCSKFQPALFGILGIQQGFILCYQTSYLSLGKSWSQPPLVDAVRVVFLNNWREYLPGTVCTRHCISFESPSVSFIINTPPKTNGWIPKMMGWKILDPVYKTKPLTSTGMHWCHMVNSFGHNLLHIEELVVVSRGRQQHISNFSMSGKDHTWWAIGWQVESFVCLCALSYLHWSDNRIFLVTYRTIRFILSRHTWIFLLWYQGVDNKAFTIFCSIFLGVVRTTSDEQFGDIFGFFTLDDLCSADPTVSFFVVAGAFDDLKACTCMIWVCFHWYPTPAKDVGIGYIGNDQIEASMGWKR